MIAVIDYGMGNLRSVQKGFEKLGYEAVVTASPQKIFDAKGVVLPGVGAFRDCMLNLEKGRLIAPVVKSISRGKPFLGICLGLQALFTESEEHGPFPGLDVIKGRVVRFPDMVEEGSDSEVPPSRLKVPHMGWNAIKKRGKAPVLDQVRSGTFLYFVHSFYVVPEDETVVSTTTTYGIEFASSIWKDNIFACQFHPEKSQKAGLQILDRFGSLARSG